MFHHCEIDSLLFGVLSCVFAGVALVDVRDLNRAAGDFLHFLGQLGNLRSFLLIRGGDLQGEQVSQGVHRRMHLRSLLFLGPVVARSVATFGGRLKRASVKDRSRRLGISLIQKPNDSPQVVRYLLENTRLHPAASLLIYRGPRRKIVRQESPLAAGPDHVAYCVEKIAQGILALWSVLVCVAMIIAAKSATPERLGLGCRERPRPINYLEPRCVNYLEHSQPAWPPVQLRGHLDQPAL
jgi:hypothetical protein